MGRPTARRTSSLLAAAVLAGLAVRLAFALGYWVDKPLTRDEHEYLSLARSLTLGRGFTYDPDLAPKDPFGRAPGYPAFLALVGGGRAVVTEVPAAIKIAQSSVGALGVLLIGLLAGRLAGPRASVAAAVLAAFYPPLVWTAGYALSEALAWPLGLCAAWLFDRACDAESGGRRAPMLLCGAVTGLAVLVRPATLLFLGPALLWLLWRRRPALALALFAGAAVIVGPWTVRNVRHYGRFVLVATDGGVTFWTGNNPLARGEGDLAANPDMKLAQLALRARHPDLREETMEPVYYDEAVAWIRAHPVSWLALEARKAFFLVAPIGPSFTLHSRLYHVTAVASYLLLLPAGLVGLWRAGPRRARLVGLWLLAASAVIVCLVFFPQDRFRVPTIDPVLLVCAGALRAGAREGGA